MKIALKDRRFRIGFLLMLLGIVAFQTAFYKRDVKSRRPSVGYLAKVADKYVLAWNEIDGVTIQDFPSLTAALDFARVKLRLTNEHMGGSGLEIERVWVEERFSRYQLFWKMSGMKFLHQLTFDNPREARFFAENFKKGLYSPSPIGHSMLLVGSELTSNEISWLKHGLDFSQQLSFRKNP